MSEIIAAYATAPGAAGLSVLRVSGPGAAALVDRIFAFGPIQEASKAGADEKNKRLEDLDGYKAAFGYIHVLDHPTQAIDQCVALRYRAPHSYTGEEQIEISIHGGAAVREAVLHEVLAAGATPAQPGEFSKRAFLNGKMDLTQAEAVMELIQADTKRQQEAAVAQLQGRNGAYVRVVREELYQLIATMEVDIEYPEYDDFHYGRQDAKASLQRIAEALENLQAGNAQGRILREGLRVVLMGEPNVGKSSLLNLLAGEDRAIVTSIPGTTRDAIEVRLDLAGIPVSVFDTAGLRQSEDVVEQLGIERSEKYKQEGHLILAVVPASDEDRILPLLQEILKDTDKSFLVLCNKIDLLEGHADFRWLEVQIQNKYPNCLGLLPISAKEGDGIQLLREAILKYYESLGASSSGDMILTSQRQQKIVGDCIKLVHAILQEFDTIPVDIMVSGVRQTLDMLGEITGEDISEQMVEEIFARFCIGK